MKKTLKQFRDFLKKNPELSSQYVSVGLTLVNKVAQPLNIMMKHLMEVQGIDPSTQPGARQRELLVQLMDKVDDSEDFDSEYDNAWFTKQYQKARGTLKKDLTKERYRQLTDLSVLPPGQLQPFEDQVNTMPVECEKTETRLIPTTEDLKSPLQKRLDHLKNADGSINFDKLQEALHVVKKYAEDLETDDKKEPVNASRAGVVVGRDRKNNRYSKVTRDFKGPFRRVPGKGE